MSILEYGNEAGIDKGKRYGTMDSDSFGIIGFCL